MIRVLSSLLLLLFALPVSAARAQDTTPPSTLFQTVHALDAKLFDAYNGCDLKTLAPLVSEDLEFYHDRTGLAVGRQAFLEGVQNNICGKVRRVLVESSLEVYPLNGYGAVEIGTHRFAHPGVDAVLGEAKFVMLWHNKNGVWELTRVISYGHGLVK